MSAGGVLYPLITAAAGLGGVLIGTFGNARREREKRDADFMARQLAEFYGPLLGLRSAIRAHGELRVKLSAAQEASWQDLVNSAREEGGTAAIQRLREGSLGQKYSAIIDDEEQKFRELILPWYKKMIEVFRDNISLSEPETRKHFPALIEFVEVWERFLNDKLPGQVSQSLGHTETKLHPLYANIEETHDRLREHLATAKRFFAFYKVSSVRRNRTR
jgi:hypothetical protein